MMRKILSTLAALFLAPFAAFAAPPATPVATTPAKTALWKIADSDTTIYLFGTMHVLKPGTVWLDGAVKTAFDQSNELVLEMVQPEQPEVAKLIMQRAIDPDGPPLTKKLTPEDAAAYAAALKKIGMDPQGFEVFEPWFVGTMLAVAPLEALGYKGDAGAEKTLTTAAKDANKPVLGLETMDEQLSFFDTLPEAAQIKMLNSTVRDGDKMEAMANQMASDWLSGRVDSLAALMNESLVDNPEVYRAIMTDRNARWADWVVNRLQKPGTVFMAVGAAHLAGKDSVQALLAQKKVKATRIN